MTQHTAPRLIIDGKSRYVRNTNRLDRVFRRLQVYRQLPSLSSRQPVGERSLRPIEHAMMNRGRPTYRKDRGKFELYAATWERRFDAGIIIEFEFYGRFMRDDDVAPRGIDKSRSTVIRQPRWHLEIWLESWYFVRTGLESLWIEGYIDNYNHRFVPLLNGKGRKKERNKSLLIVYNIHR